MMNAQNKNDRARRPVPMLVHYASTAQRKRQAEREAHEMAQDAASALEADCRIRSFVDLRAVDCPPARNDYHSGLGTDMNSGEALETAMATDDELAFTPPAKKPRVRKPRIAKPIEDGVELTDPVPEPKPAKKPSKPRKTRAAVQQAQVEQE